MLVACVGGGSNAIGLFHPFIEDEAVALVGVEPGGSGIHTGRHGATLSAGVPGILHGKRTYVMADDDGQIFPAHSVSAGLDYPGVGPEHAYLKDEGRARYEVINDDEAIDAFLYLCRTEGSSRLSSPRMRSPRCRKLAPTLPRDAILIVNLSGRGDKDVTEVREILAGRSPDART